MSDDALDAIKLADKIAPLLKDNSPQWQSTVLADLTARWLAGHHPLVREQAWKIHNELVAKLTVINELMLFGPEGHPGHKDRKQ